MNLVELAQRIKNRRLKQKVTLEELAKRANLTRSMLSKVENFRVTPSLDALARIAKGLDVTVSELLDGLDEKAPQLVIIRQDERKVVERDRPTSRIIYQDLAHKRHDKVMTPLLLEVPSGIARKELLPHEGEEFLMVVEGSVDLEYEDQSHHLQAGDCAYFDAKVKHRVVNTSKRTAKVLCVFSGSHPAS
ncbi:MAG: cupin domain-containing protein [Verrucomicrobia bacterium]|nr:cupin domain-containing protein [Verrucomicrobiota bacterium]